ncbi:MAG TPA: hypothetical protein VNN25_02065 [Thermoanaerobaculia bacterium]|nr:hypothetical protein [Thermoanaerobaculia bacterium]
MSDTLASGVPAPGDEPVTPTTTHYQEVAKQFLDAFIAAIAQIPMLEEKHASTAQFVQTHSRFSNEFVSTVLTSVVADPQLQNINKFDVVEARDTLQYLDAFRSVIDQVQLFLTNLKFSCATRKARAVFQGLQVYAVAKGLGRDATSASVASLAKIMKRDLNRPGRPLKKKEVPPPTNQ